MKIKHRFSDFRVTEVLRSGLVQERGPFTLYRVSKRKLSTAEAIGELAHLCDVDPGTIAVAGLKDRQGITVQHMTVPGRRQERLKRPELRIEPIGFTEQELSSADSRGNSFEITARAVSNHELSVFKKNIAPVREHGVANYFDEQRFGNLRHEQGWIARDLMVGEHERALKSLLSAPSPFDDERNRAFKSAVHRAWGDWRTCRDVAGRFGSHHSIFEHLQSSPGDFAGAFFHVATRLRLIHLYAFQSHVWNRAVAERIRQLLPANARVRVPSLEGPLVFFGGDPPSALVDRSLPLPGAGLEGVEDAEDRALFARVLEAEGLTPESFRIDGVPGFQLKPEDRPVLVLPRHLRVRPAVPDADHPGLFATVLRFELPRGAYASLVVKRLFARSRDARERAHAAQGGGARASREQAGARDPRSGGKGRAGGASRGSWSRPEREGDRTGGRERSRDDRGGGQRRGRDERGGGGSSRGRERGGRPGPWGGRGRDDRSERSGGSRERRSAWGGERRDSDRRDRDDRRDAAPERRGRGSAWNRGGADRGRGDGDRGRREEGRPASDRYSSDRYGSDRRRTDRREHRDGGRGTHAGGGPENRERGGNGGGRSEDTDPWKAARRRGGRGDGRGSSRSRPPRARESRSEPRSAGRSRDQFNDRSTDKEQ